MAPMTLGPDALRALLEQYGLQIVKTREVPANMGKSPELVMCQKFIVIVKGTEDDRFGQ